MNGGLIPVLAVYCTLALMGCKILCLRVLAC